MHELAVLYKEKGDYDKAEQLLLEALEGRRLKLGDTHTHTLKSLNNLIELYEAWGKPEKANEWRAKLPQAENIRKRHSPPNGPIFLTYKASEFLDKACQQNVSTDLDFSII